MFHTKNGCFIAHTNMSRLWYLDNYFFYFSTELYHNSRFLCPHLLKAAVGHIAFHREVTAILDYVRFVTRP